MAGQGTVAGRPKASGYNISERGEERMSFVFGKSGCLLSSGRADVFCLLQTRPSLATPALPEDKRHPLFPETPTPPWPGIME